MAKIQMGRELSSLVKRTDWLIKGLQAVVSVVLPIAEGYLVNRATSTSDASSDAWIGALIVVASLHLVLAIALLLVPSTPGRALLTLEAEKRSLSTAKREARNVGAQRDRFMNAFLAQLLADAVLDAAGSALQGSVDAKVARGIAEDLLQPFIAERVSIFDFRDPQAMWNFAVYLHDPQTDLLRVFARKNDDRIATRNRSWARGVGHVGICFARDEMIITEDLVRSPELFALEDAAPTADGYHYRSAASIPLQRGNETVGVLVVTSSNPRQFTNEEHGIIFDKMAQNLSRLLTITNVEWAPDAIQTDAD